MSDKKIIAVVGATGVQGGGLADAILSDPNSGFAARAITRDPGKDKAKALAAKGAEVVKADLDDVESLKKAFAGAYGDVVGNVAFFSTVMFIIGVGLAGDVSDALDRLWLVGLGGA